jgi:hypothetical protein
MLVLVLYILFVRHLGRMVLFHGIPFELENRQRGWLSYFNSFPFFIVIVIIVVVVVVVIIIRKVRTNYLETEHIQMLSIRSSRFD